LKTAGSPCRLRCLLVGELAPEGMAALRAIWPEEHLEVVPAADAVGWGRAQPFDVIWDCFGEEQAVARALRANPEVTWLHTSAAGIDRLTGVLPAHSGLTVTHGAGIGAIPIAEFVVGCLLAHAKRLLDFASLHRQHRWSSPELRELGDLRVVMMGLGEIGGAVVARLIPFGCPIIGVRRDPGRGAPDGVLRVVGAAQLDEACAGADALVVAAPLTPATRRLVGAQVLRALAPNSVLVNVARGAIVDEAALLRGLAGGQPSAAFLDALEEEPLPPRSPLWSTPGVLVTSHSSWSSPHFAQRSGELFAEQLRRRRGGHRLRNLADLAVGY